MKEKTKIILTAIISVTATLSITAFAVFRASANNITFSSDKTEKDNVEESLNELYDNINFGNATASDILEGKTALVNGNYIIGTFNKIKEIEFSYKNVGSEIQPSYGTSPVTLNKSYKFEEKGLYIIILLCGLTGHYSVPSISISGISYKTLGSSSVIGFITSSYGQSAINNVYLVESNGTETIQISVTFTLNESMEVSDKNGINLSVIKIT